MATTLTLIGTTTIGAGGSSSIGFSSIPATYTDLMIVGAIKTNRTTSNDFIKGYFNTDQTDNNYTGYLAYGSATGTASGVTYAGATAPRYFGECAGDNSSVTNNFSSTYIYIQDYGTAGITKCWIGEGGQSAWGGTNAQIISNSIGRWSGTAAINAVTFVPGVQTLWLQHSTLSLYGVKGSN
jgi:hypothetical protein